LRAAMPHPDLVFIPLTIPTFLIEGKLTGLSVIPASEMAAVCTAAGLSVMSPWVGAGAVDAMWGRGRVRGC